MPKTKISEFDVDPANNTDINSINIAEGCAPSGINNAIRQLMSDLKEFQTGAGGDPFNGAVNGTVGATTPNTGTFTTVTANTSMSTDTISEKTSAAGVTVDGVLLKDNAVSASSGFTQNSTFNSASTMGFKNRIINGAMMIDQRNAGASVTPANGVTTFITDRWGVVVNQSSKLTSQQSTTAPTGFTNSLLITSSSAYSLASTDYFLITQKIEGFNTADFAWGTASASPVTVSFKVRSSLTGTFGGVIRNSGSNRFYPFTYTINSANTFEDKTITIAGDTTGTWLTNNGTGLELIFSVGVGSSYLQNAGAWTSSFALSAVGSTSLVGTNGATFYITGVQLEKGSTATSFDYRPYGTELALCQRYCYVVSQAVSNSRIFGFNYNSSTALNRVNFPVQTRTNPTGITVSSAANTFTLYQNGTTATISSIAFDAGDTYGANLAVSATVTANAGSILALNTSGNKIEFTGMEL